MLKVVDGVPGSGKSYFMVQYLSKYFTYDKFYETFHIKDSVLVISNIEGLRIPHMILDGPELIGNPELGIVGKYTRETFFTIPNFEKLMLVFKVKNVILMIDECQKEWLFPAGYKHPDVMYFFQYHRHIGVDLTLGTQDAKLICRHALVCAEYIARATARSKSIIGNFSYKFHDISGNFLYSKVLRKSQDIFRAYKSMRQDEISKPKNVIAYWASFVVVLLVVAGVLFKTALGTLKDKSKPKVAAVVSKPVQASISSPKRSFVPPPVSVSPSPMAFIPPPSGLSGYAKPLPTEKIEPVEVIRIIGFSSSADPDGKNVSVNYLLSNGLNVKSKKKYQVDDVFKG